MARRNRHWQQARPHTLAIACAHARTRISGSALQPKLSSPPLRSLLNRRCVAAVTKETDVGIKEMDIQLREALLKQLACTEEKDALIREKDALAKEIGALTKDKDALAKEKDALAQQLAAAISTCAALKNSADRSVEIHTAAAYPPDQAAAAGASMRRHMHATRT